MRDLDTIYLEEIYQEILDEGRISDALKMGALGAATAIQPNVSAQNYETPQKTYYYTNDIIPNNEFVKLWGLYYQTDRNPQKNKRAYEVLNKKYQIPSDAKNGIKTAAYIFGGDMGVNKNTLIDILIKTGEVESGYKTKVQYGGGPARGYWQVEPETAMDLIKNSSALFGEKFNKVFGKYNINEIVSNNDYNQLEKLLELDSNLAASFAAAKWIVSASNYLKFY